MKQGADLVFTSESQERLAALLAKAFDVVPFAPDDACEDIFSKLALFCKLAIEKRNVQAHVKFSALDIETLIGISKSVHHTPLPQPPQKRERESDSGPVVPVAGPGRSIDRWKFESAYNVVDIVSWKETPFQLVVKAKPPVAGNKAPQTFWMDETDLTSMDDFGGKPGKKLKENLAKALQAFFNDAFPNILANLLSQTSWGQKIVKTKNDK